MTTAVNFDTGRQLGRYELVFPAGKGGMGQVWAAKLRGKQGFRKIVALKTLLASEAQSSEMQSMLRNEAMLASHIKSPHVAETLDFDLHEGVPYLVMEWVDGESLADLLDELDGPMSIKHVVGIVTQACKGLQATHNALDAAGNPLGLVHRDISPPNLLISYAGLVKLADFGIAKVTGHGQLDTEQGLKGKFNFMAPEQVRGTSVDARTDVFAMSVLMYRLVTGVYPFAGSDPGETLWQISSSITPRGPRSHNPNLPLRIEEVILKGLEKEPADRFQSAEELLAALERAVPPTLRGNSEQAIAELMQKTLGEHMEQRRKQTARALLSVPPGPIDKLATPSISTLKGLTYTAPPSTMETVDASEAVAGLKPRSSRRNQVVLGSIAGLLASAAIAFLTLRLGAAEDTSISPNPAPITAAAPIVEEATRELSSPPSQSSLGKLDEEATPPVSESETVATAEASRTPAAEPVTPVAKRHSVPRKTKAKAQSAKAPKATRSQSTPASDLKKPY